MQMQAFMQAPFVQAHLYDGILMSRLMSGGCPGGQSQGSCQGGCPPGCTCVDGMCCPTAQNGGQNGGASYGMQRQNGGQSGYQMQAGQGQSMMMSYGSQDQCPGMSQGPCSGGCPPGCTCVNGMCCPTPGGGAQNGYSQPMPMISGATNGYDMQDSAKPLLVAEVTTKCPGGGQPVGMCGTGGQCPSGCECQGMMCCTSTCRCFVSRFFWFFKITYISATIEHRRTLRLSCRNFGRKRSLLLFFEILVNMT